MMKHIKYVILLTPVLIFTILGLCLIGCNDEPPDTSGPNLLKIQKESIDSSHFPVRRVEIPNTGGNYSAMVTFEYYADNMHYRVFQNTGGGMQIINVTLDSTLISPVKPKQVVYATEQNKQMAPEHKEVQIKPKQAPVKAKWSRDTTEKQHGP